MEAEETRPTEIAAAADSAGGLSGGQSPLGEASAPSNLDTLQTALFDLESREVASADAAFSPGGQLPIPSEPAQLGFDGVPYAFGPCDLTGAVQLLPEPESAAELRADLEHAPATLPRLLAFDFAAAGVQMCLDDWRPELAEYLRTLSSTDEKRAVRVEHCGDLFAVPKCRSCQRLDHKQAVRGSNCEGRTCPSCAKKRAGRHQAKLHKAFELMPPTRNGRGWFMHVITTVNRGTSVESLQADRRLLVEACRAAWGILKREGALCAVAFDETGNGGMVHANLLAYHPWLSKSVIEELREETEAVTGARQYNVKRVAKERIVEVVKYVTKGSVKPGVQNYAHPLLAAMVDVAWRHGQCVRWYGGKAWKAVIDAVDSEEHRECAFCGSTDVGLVYIHQDDYGAVLAQEGLQARGPPDGNGRGRA